MAQRHLQEEEPIGFSDNATSLLDDDFQGFLNSNNVSGPDFDDEESSNRSDGGRDAYEFVAFLLWYLFLVLCCVIPTCCAYRRRRMVEARLAQQQASVSRIERQNIYILSSLTQHGQQNSERIREERRTKITEKLKDTTMVSIHDVLYYRIKAHHKGLLLLV
jgi:hypothetical protein